MANDMNEILEKNDAMEVEVEEHKAALAATQQKLDTSTKKAEQRTAELRAKDAEILHCSNN